MHLHPLSVHFPIALLFAAGGFYVASFFREADFCMKAGGLLHLAGILGLIVALFSGMQAEGSVIHTQTIHALIKKHELLSYILIWGFGLLYVHYLLRKKSAIRMERIGFITVFCVFLGLMTYSAFLGGKMVYEEGAGVAPMKPHLQEQFQSEQAE